MTPVSQIRRRFPWPERLGLRAGELVEVRSRDEILSTLDRAGRLDGMPFMPEMLQFCGKRFQVSSRADKSCDTVLKGDKSRRVYDAVHLDGVRCDGSAHGGCQALCLTWWREAWLKRAEEAPAAVPLPMIEEPRCTEEGLHRATTVRGLISGTIYSCQVTSLLDFSEELRWYDPRPVFRALRAGNVTARAAFTILFRAATNMLRRRLGGATRPLIRGRCRGKTPSERIPGLQPGDWVVIKSKEEIEETLNRRQRNRGLFFDIEELPYCGRRMRLLQKVDRIIDERTGAMRGLPNDCWIIEGAYCEGVFSRHRLFCTRQIYSFWREIWLRRADEVDDEVGDEVGDELHSAEDRR